MAVLDQVTSERQEIEDESLAPTQGGGESLRLVERLRHIRKLLSREEARWIGTAEAKGLLGVASEHIVEAWVRMGLLHSRTLPDGRIQVPLDEVLYRREAQEGLSAIGGDELTDEELRIMRETRPGTNPWEREKPDPAG